VWTFHGQHVRLLRSSESGWNQAGCFSCIFTKVFVKYQIAGYDRFLFAIFFREAYHILCR